MTAKENISGGEPTPDRPSTVSVLTLQDMKSRGEKISMLTAYDATFGHAAACAGVDVLLVGDSLGMVCKGERSTLAVSMQDMGYHTCAVARGIARAPRRPLLIADMPFGSYQAGLDEAVRNAVDLMRAGANMVKVEGGGWVSGLVERLVACGIPVCAHLGLTPQSVNALGGYRVQGNTPEKAEALVEEAIRLESSGATLLVLEMVPAKLAAAVTERLSRCATIGIGAGAGTDGQVLVLHDMLGLSMRKLPRFTKDFLKGASGIRAALEGYVEAVKRGRFPDDAVHAW